MRLRQRRGRRRRTKTTDPTAHRQLPNNGGGVIADHRAPCVQLSLSHGMPMMPLGSGLTDHRRNRLTTNDLVAAFAPRLSPPPYSLRLPQAYGQSPDRGCSKEERRATFDRSQQFTHAMHFIPASDRFQSRRNRQGISLPTKKPSTPNTFKNNTDANRLTFDVRSMGVRSVQDKHSVSNVERDSLDAVQFLPGNCGFLSMNPGRHRQTNPSGVSAHSPFTGSQSLPP